jgi:hypothetical protein
MDYPSLKIGTCHNLWSECYVTGSHRPWGGSSKGRIVQGRQRHKIMKIWELYVAGTHRPWTDRLRTRDCDHIIPNHFHFVEPFGSEPYLLKVGFRSGTL